MQTQTQKPKFISQGETFESFDQLVKTWQSRNQQAELQEVNAYTDPQTGEADYYTLRIMPPSGKKEFRQISKDDKGRWQWKEPSGKLPLFNRTRISQCENIVIVEGEKCVRAFTKLGFDNFAATTAPQGANGAVKADWSILAGKTCYIWRDNDEPGEKYENAVIEILLKLTPPTTVKKVRVGELRLDPKDDIVDYLEIVGETVAEKRAAVEVVLQDAESLNVTEALAEKLSRIASGKFRNIAFPQLPLLSHLSKALMPGTVTTLCGEPGAGKSFFLLEQFWRWSLEENINVKLFMFEDDDAFHQTRVLAQMSGYSDLTDVDYCEQNIDFVKSLFDQYRPHLEYFSRNLEVANSQQKTLDQIADWVKVQAEAGVEIIGIDPITAAKVSDKPWIDDQKFLFRVKEIVESTGSRLIISTHPRLGQAGKPSLSGMAGGASYPRFSQTVFWLKNFEKPEQTEIWKNGSMLKISHKQALEIRKARNGKGQGQKLATNLNHQNLCTDEYGIIDEK